MLIGISVLVILLPIIAAQYVLAIVGLIALYRRGMKRGAYIAWNICIILLFFVGTIAFLIYNRVRPVACEKVDENR